MSSEISDKRFLYLNEPESKIEKKTGSWVLKYFSRENDGWTYMRHGAEAETVVEIRHGAKAEHIKAVAPAISNPAVKKFVKLLIKQKKATSGRHTVV